MKNNLEENDKSTGIEFVAILVSLLALLVSLKSLNIDTIMEKRNRCELERLTIEPWLTRLTFLLFDTHVQKLNYDGSRPFEILSSSQLIKFERDEEIKKVKFVNKFLELSNFLNPKHGDHKFGGKSIPVDIHKKCEDKNLYNDCKKFYDFYKSLKEMAADFRSSLIISYQKKCINK